MGNPMAWGVFSLLILGMLALDLGIFRKDDHEVTLRESLLWTAVWIVLGLLFGVFVYLTMGLEAGLAYWAGYLIEKSLSMDNIFVFQVVFTYFAVPPRYRHKILFWGVVGALLMRALFIFAGVALLNAFHWLIYAFGGLLIFTGVRMVTEHGKSIEPDRNPIVRLFKRVLPVLPSYKDGRFFVREKGKLYATPLFLVLIVVESTDLLFAIDSIPAIMAITTDPFIIYTSNVFALLGLRALYFALAGLMQLFHYLNYGLSFILIFVGIKMLVSGVYKIPVWVALVVVVLTLAVSIFASLRWPKPVESGEPALEHDG